MDTTARPLAKGLWYYGWNIVAVAILSQVAANGLTYNAFSLFLKDWAADLHVKISLLQLTVVGMVWIAAPISPFVGTLVDKSPARPLFAFGIFGMAAFYVGVSFVTQAWQLIALYTVVASVALCFATAIPCNALISRWFVRRRGVALGLSAFGIGMAGVVLPPLVAHFLPTLGWRLIWRIGGLLLAFVVAPIVLLTIKDRPTPREGFHYLAGEAGMAPDLHGATASRLSWKEVLSRRNFWLIVAIYLPMMALNGGTQQNLGPFSASHGWSGQDAGILLSVLSFSHLVATFALGIVADRFGVRLPFAGLALVMVAGALAFAFGNSYAVIVAGAVLIGFGAGLYTLLAAGLAAEFGAEGFGRAYGLAMAFIPIMSLAPFVLAKVREMTGSYTPGFLGLGALVLVAGVLALFLSDRRGSPRPAVH